LQSLFDEKAQVGFWDKFKLMDVKGLQNMLKDNKAITGVTPRWILPTMVHNEKGDLKTSSFLLIGDSDREIKLGIGRGLVNTISPLKDNECYA